MKIIDEKGRLFGKINIIDFLVILFLFCLMPMFYYGYKIFIKKSDIETLKQEEPKKEYIDINVSGVFIKLKPEVAEIISIGDKELDKNGNIIGEIVELGKVSSYIYRLEIGGTKKFLKEDLNLKQVPVKLKIKAEMKQNILYYKDKQILDKGTLEFITDKYQAEATSLSLFQDSLEPIMVGTEDTKTLLNTEERLDTLEKKVGSINITEERLDTLEKKVGSINITEERLNTLEKKVDSLLSKKSRR